MKYHLALCCVLAAFSVIAQPTQNLEAYYPFNGNMEDESGNNHHGTHGPPGWYGAESYFTFDRWGNSNAAFYQPITFIENSLFNDISSDTSGTWSAWIRPGKMLSSGYRSIISVGSTIDYDWISLRFEKNGRISVSANDGTYVPGYPDIENLLWEVTTDSQVVSLLEWVHVALVHDGVSPKLYIDGSEVPQTVNPSSLDQGAWINDFDSLNNVVIGGSQVLGGSWLSGGMFQGIIDDVRVYSSDLSASQILDLYNEENPNLKPNWLVKDSLAYYSDGPVAVGIDSVGTHMLAVDGSIGAREIVVESSGWSDYVFEEGYQLQDIKDLEEFIQKNNHLPNIPSESEVLENGIKVSEMNAKLLEKIEELTLYIIKQNQQIQDQRQRSEALEEEVLELRRIILSMGN